MKGSTVAVCTVLFAMIAAGQDDGLRKRPIKMSKLPATQQSAIDAAIGRWNRQFKGNAQDSPQGLMGDASGGDCPARAER